MAPQNKKAAPIVGGGLLGVVQQGSSNGREDNRQTPYLQGNPAPADVLVARAKALLRSPEAGASGWANMSLAMHLARRARTLEVAQ